jgi:hypothetical protein
MLLDTPLCRLPFWERPAPSARTLETVRHRRRGNPHISSRRRRKSQARPPGTHARHAHARGAPAACSKQYGRGVEAAVKQAQEGQGERHRREKRHKKQQAAKMAEARGCPANVMP